MKQKRLAMTLVEILAVLAVVGIISVLLIFFLLVTSRRGGREITRRNTCRNNLKNIALALHMYESEYGSLPPAYTVDEDGNRLHSWRTLLLPYMDYQELFKSIDLSKPWDDSANADARKEIVSYYQCSSSPDLDGQTTYQCVIGPDCVFTGSVPRKLSDATDDKSQTLFVIEVSHKQAMHWMSPHDISYEEVLKYGSETRMTHDGIMQAAFLDGSVTTLSLDSIQENLKAMLTVAGGEKIEED